MKQDREPWSANLPLAMAMMALAISSGAGAQPYPMPDYLPDRSQMQMQNCGYDQSEAVKNLIQRAVPTGEIHCYSQHAFTQSPGLTIDLVIPAGSQTAEVGFNFITLKGRVNKSVNVIPKGWDTASCADAPAMAWYLFSGLVYDGNQYLKMPKVTGCSVVPSVLADPYKGQSPLGLPLNRWGGMTLGNEVRTIRFTVSLAEMRKTLPPHLKRP